MSRINYRLYASLLIMGLCPAIYSALRIYFMGQMPDPGSYSIAGQLGWLNLAYEVIQEAILLPLYFFLGQVVKDRAIFANRVRSGLLLSASLYTAMAVVICVWTRPLLRWMATSPDIIDASVSYIRIESVSNIFGLLSSFTLIVLVTLGREKFLYLFTGVRLVLSVLFDTLLISNFSFSLRLGVNGIGYCNILVNGLLFAISLWLLSREGIRIVGGGKPSFRWMRELGKVSGLSGLESLIRNTAYMGMVIRMVNVVQEQGLYWVANSFIWGWLLLPITQMSELIKREIAIAPSSLQTRSRKYFTLTGLICAVWCLSIPLWKPFMSEVLGYADVDRLFQLVLLLLGFYIVYAFQSAIHALFLGLGRTNYIFVQSLITNAVYYGGAYLLYRMGIWVPSLTGIALLFGWGMVFGTGVSLGLYIWMLKESQKKALSSIPNFP